MAYTPPSIDVFSTDDMRQLTNYLTDAGIGISDFVANQAVAMHPRIAETLRLEGVDGPAGVLSGFGRGSIANQNATQVIRPLKKAAEHLDTAAKLSRAAWFAWHKYLVTPVEIARREMTRGSDRRMKV